MSCPGCGLGRPPETLVAQLRVLIDEVQRSEDDVRGECLAGQESSLGTEVLEVFPAVSAGPQVTAQQALGEVGVPAGCVTYQ